MFLFLGPQGDLVEPAVGLVKWVLVVALSDNVGLGEVRGVRVQAPVDTSQFVDDLTVELAAQTAQLSLVPGLNLLG